MLIFNCVGGEKGGTRYANQSGLLMDGPRNET